jgi:hypothetical protein
MPQYSQCITLNHICDVGPYVVTLLKCTCIRFVVNGHHETCVMMRLDHSPTLGAHTHAHGFWVGMGEILLFMRGHGWALVLCIPASSSKSESILGCREYANQEALRAEANDNE